jgi:hypothetical protein
MGLNKFFLTKLLQPHDTEIPRTCFYLPSRWAQMVDSLLQSTVYPLRYFEQLFHAPHISYAELHMLLFVSLACV